MEENRRPFGQLPGGAPVDEITLRDGALACKIITYGGAVRSLTVPDRDGNPVDVVQGFDPLEDYLAQDKHIGALVGRYANRIGGARFTLNGTEYTLAANDGENSLHGGNVGFDKRVWSVERLTDRAVVLSLVSPDGEEGYPGTLTAVVAYTLAFGGLDIEYRARCDKDTVCSITNHSYFNLSGHDSGPVTGQHIRIFSNHYTPAGPGLIPTGEIAPVKGTPMDLWDEQKIGARIDDPFEQLKMAGGFDNNWAVLNWDGTLRPVARVWSPDTGIMMEAATSLPGMQFYTGNFLAGCPAGKGGAAYGDRWGLCLEAQFFPDSPNKPGFPSCVLRAGEEYRHKTVYRFSTLDSARRL